MAHKYIKILLDDNTWMNVYSDCMHRFKEDVDYALSKREFLKIENDVGMTYINPRMIKQICEVR